MISTEKPRSSSHEASKSVTARFPMSRRVSLLLIEGDSINRAIMVSRSGIRAMA